MKNLFRALCFLVLLALLGSDLWFFLNRDSNSLVYQPKPSSFFYRTHPGLKVLKYRNGILSGAIEPAGHQLRLVDEPLGRMDGNSFSLPLEDNKSVNFQDEDGRLYQLKMEFNYWPLKSSGSKSRCGEGNCLLQVKTAAFSRAIDGPEPCFWTPKDYSIPGLEPWFGKLKELKNSSPDFNRQLQALSGFLVARFQLSEGVPTVSMVLSHPAEQIKKIMAHTSQISCTNITIITAYSLNALGIPARLVNTRGGIGSAPTRPHSVMEILDPLSEDWFLSDLAIGVLYIENAAGRKLNLPQFIDYYESGDLTSLNYCYWDKSKSEFKLVDFARLPETIQEHLITYYFARQILIYFSSKSSIYRGGTIPHRLEDYFLEYRYSLPLSFGPEFWLWHFVCRLSLYLTLGFALLCGIFFLQMIKARLKRSS